VKLATSPDSPATVVQVGRSLHDYVGRLGPVWVEGQIAEVKRRAAFQRVFLTLRDGAGAASIQLQCSRQLFDSQSRPIIEGLGVVVCARPKYYVPRGQISFEVTEFRLLGLGELLARIEALRQALAAEGLFAPERKRRLPFIPRLVGLVTASGSDAMHDVVENARRRWPAVRFEFAFATMQGPRSVPEVMEALARLERHADVDVIIVARGGGSVEDLIQFSDEALIRAVHGMRTPVVSAIGHDQDQPLLDLVADVRASTPTDAAARVVPDVAEEAAQVRRLRDGGRVALRRLLDREAAAVAGLRARRRAVDPRRVLEARAIELVGLRGRARQALRHRIERASDDVRSNVTRARALSPLATLRRGYSVLQSEDGRVIDSVSAVHIGQPVSVRILDGRLRAVTTAVEPLPAPAGDDGDA
jgi:exodeoxyribonuclease VII large subunit